MKATRNTWNAYLLFVGWSLLVTPCSVTADIQSSVQRLLPATVAVQWTRKADEAAAETDEDSIAYVFDVNELTLDADDLDSVHLASGTVVSSDGLIVTAHLPNEDGALEVVWLDGKRAKANIVVRDRRTDLQLVRADLSGIEHVELRQDSVKLAQPVVTVTAIDMRDRAAGTGIVTALNRPLGDKAADVLQTDISIGAMSAGAPLGDTEGRVAGIVIAKKSDSANEDGPAFVVPARYVRALLDAYKPDAKDVVVLQRGWLGVQLNEDDEVVEHPYIEHVFNKSPAEAGKLKEGDVILKVRGERPAIASDVVRILGYSQPNEEIQVVVKRDGAEKTLQVMLGEFPEENDLVFNGSNHLELVQPSLLLVKGKDGTFQAMDRQQALHFWLNATEAVEDDDSTTPRWSIAPQQDGSSGTTDLLLSDYYDLIVANTEKSNDATIKVQRSDVEKQLSEVSKQVKALAEQVNGLAKALEKLNAKLDD